LFSFNVGVEVGQLCIVSFVFPLFLLLAKKKNAKIIIVIFSISIGITGLMWFIERAFL
jgi:hypothetical protein